MVHSLCIGQSSACLSISSFLLLRASIELLFCEIAYTYGMRRGEILNLRVRQANLVRRTLRLERDETKNGEAREVEMTPALYELVKQAVVGKTKYDYLITRKSKKGIKAQIGDFRKHGGRSRSPLASDNGLAKIAASRSARRDARAAAGGSTLA
jgi:integrase